MKFRAVTIEAERDFEREHIATQREKYLSTDVLERTKYDLGYQRKMAVIESALSGTRGWILDVGANTCGEAEVLTSRGYSLIAMDINEVALDLSQQRVDRFGRRAPSYVAGDANQIPLANDSISFILCFETLHHLENPGRALSELNRVLLPGGKFFMFEPYSYNPYRRLSEIRDKFKGTIEKSFGKKELRALVQGAGFQMTHVKKTVLPPSKWKMRYVNPGRRVLKLTYHAVARRIPWLFGSLDAVATKPGRLPKDDALPAFESILRCPVSGAEVVFVGSGFLSIDRDSRLLYPAHNGIPVLIADDATTLDLQSWEKLLGKKNR